jgi:hydroxyquinol 1,2-dioxygenase
MTDTDSADLVADPTTASTTDSTISSAAREQALTDAVAASFASASSPRYAEVMASLVRHLHAFARDVRLTDAEWHTAIDVLTRTGQLCDERRQEFVLLSDVLGMSMLTVAVNADPDPAVTPSTVFGPFFVEGSPQVPLGGDIARGAVGQPCWIEGSVRGVDGEPVAGARIEVWEADDDGFYDVQYEGFSMEGAANRGHLFTDSDGGYRFWSVRPAAYPIPVDGPVGELLRAAGRRWMRPAHVHFMITAPGYRRLTTHVFAAGDPYLSDDAVFGVNPALVADFPQHAPDEPRPPGAPTARPADQATDQQTDQQTDQPWSSLTFDFTLAREESNA